MLYFFYFTPIPSLCKNYIYYSTPFVNLEKTYNDCYYVCVQTIWNEKRKTKCKETEINFSSYVRGSGHKTQNFCKRLEKSVVIFLLIFVSSNMQKQCLLCLTFVPTPLKTTTTTPHHFSSSELLER